MNDLSLVQCNMSMIIGALSLLFGMVLKSLDLKEISNFSYAIGISLIFISISIVILKIILK